MAGRTVKALPKAKAAIENRAALLFSDGIAQAERGFTPRASSISANRQSKRTALTTCALRELAPKFDKAAASARNSFYNPALASKISTRIRI